MNATVGSLKLIAAPFRAVLALAGTLATRIGHIITAMRNRRDVELLAGFDDRLLADIGLTRSDLRYALGEPFWRDPGLVLTARAGERRAPRRRRRVDPAPRLVAGPPLAPCASDHANKACAVLS